jgi:hypothetical protein
MIKKIISRCSAQRREDAKERNAVRDSENCGMGGIQPGLTVVVTHENEKFSRNVRKESRFFAELVSASVPACVSAFSDKFRTFPPTVEILRPFVREIPRIMIQAIY